jgi:hypothetical protein
LGKIGIDAPVAHSVGIGQRITSRRRRNPEMIELGTLRAQTWVAPDAVIQRAMRHTSPETKRLYQLGMVDQVRKAMERANLQVYGERSLVN